MCLICEKHYERCNCKEPKWGTSHDDVSLEEAKGAPTLADRQIEQRSHIREAQSREEFNQMDQKLTKAGAIVDDIANAPPEVQESVRRLNEAGIGVKVYRGTEAQLGPLLSCSKPMGNYKSEANEIDKIHYEAYTKSGGKLN